MLLILWLPGETCDIDIDNCNPDQCDHGVCEDAVNAFLCNCESGWTGELCDVST